MKSIILKILRLIKRAWQFIVIASVLFGFYAYFHEKKPDVQFTIIGDPNVFDVNKSVNDLAIFFREKDIEKENLNLKVYDVSIENKGESDILKNLYDDALPWGFSIDNGDIVSAPRIVNGNSEYLNLNLKPQIRENKIEFEKVIFEHNKFFVIEFLVLHKKNEIPGLVPFGKIAGIDQFNVVRNANQEKSIAGQLVGGSFIIHLIRLFSYTLISIVMLVVLVFVSEKIDTIKTKRKERKREEIFQQYLNNDPILDNNVALFIGDLYSRGGLHALIRFGKKIKRENVLVAEFEEYLENKRKYAEDFNEYHYSNRRSLLFDDYYSKELFSALINNVNNVKIINPSLKAELNKLIPYLKRISNKNG